MTILDNLRKSLAVVIVTCLIGILQSDRVYSQVVWLDQLDLSAATQGYGVPMKNKTIDGKALTINGETFRRGFGTHSESSLRIQLDGKATRFTARVGVDDEVRGHEPAVEFIVNADGKVIWSSSIMRLGDSAKTCSVPLAGIKKLELIVTDGGNGNYYDHADWVNAWFETKGVSSFATTNPVPDIQYILTPPPPLTPRINGAKIVGVRPGSPFQFQVAATGHRPMIFTAVGLPKGLKISPKTGIIIGQLNVPGNFIVTLRVNNSRGKATKKLKIVCGERIALTPPMGWNSWNCFADQVSADKVKRAAEAMIKSGLVNHGWTYINIDDF